MLKRVNTLGLAKQFNNTQDSLENNTISQGSKTQMQQYTDSERRTPLELRQQSAMNERRRALSIEEFGSKPDLKHDQSVDSPQLSKHFWEFVKKLDIPVSSSLSYRNQIGSYYERLVNTNEQTPQYLQPHETHKAFSDRQTAVQSSNERIEQSQSVLEKRTQLISSDDNNDGTFSQMTQPGVKRNQQFSQLIKRQAFSKLGKELARLRD